MGVDPGVNAIKLLPHLERHDDLFERRVAGAFADTVDRALHLADAVLNSRQRVRDGQAEIVVAMRAQDGLVDVLHLAAKILDQQAVFFRRAVADGIRKIDGGCAGIDDGFGNLREEIDIGASGVFGGELDIVAKRPRVADALDGASESFFAGLVQFVFEVDVTGGEKDMDAGFVGSFEGLGAAIDVFLDASRQARDYGRAYFRGYAAYRLVVAFGRDGKACFENIDVELFQLTRHSQLLVDGHAETGSLLAIAQSRVKND